MTAPSREIMGVAGKNYRVFVIQPAVAFATRSHRCGFSSGRAFGPLVAPIPFHYTNRGLNNLMKRTATLLILGATLWTVPLLQGCSGEQSQTVERTTTTTHPGVDSANADHDTTTTTTKTTTQTPDEHSSVLGATANAVGTVIAAPFRLVGDAFEIVF
jgi:hypothetical protein